MTKICCILLSLLPLLGIGAFDDGMLEEQAMFADASLSIASHNRVFLSTMYEQPTTASHPETTTLVRRAVATTTPFSEAYILWTATSTSCAKPAPTLTIACATGGTITLVRKEGVSVCTKASASTLKCAKISTAATASVVVKCTAAYKVTASLPALTFTKCNNGIKGNLASQFINLQQVCRRKANVFNLTVVPSRVCTPTSQLIVTQGQPFCWSLGNKCTNTSKTTCSIATSAVKISSPSTFSSSLCVL